MDITADLERLNLVVTGAKLQPLRTGYAHVVNVLDYKGLKPSSRRLEKVRLGDSAKFDYAIALVGCIGCGLCQKQINFQLTVQHCAVIDVQTFKLKLQGNYGGRGWIVRPKGGNPGNA